MSSQVHVDRLDFEKRKAYVRPVNVDYDTDAIRYTQVRFRNSRRRGAPGPAVRVQGDVLVRSQVVGFKKIKFSQMRTSDRANLSCLKMKIQAMIRLAKFHK